jgi:hypothetical protein
MKKSIFAAAAVAVLGTMGAAQAATLGGTFAVTAVNVTGVNRAQSEATSLAFDNARNGLSGTIAGLDTFTYSGNLSFKTVGPNTTTISDWLQTGVGGSVSGLDIGGLQLSKSSIENGTATTTFFLFERLADIGAGDFTVTHDDGIAIFNDGAFLGGLKGPNTVKVTQVDGFERGAFSILYVATNNNPSVLNVDANVAPVPLPAALPLLAAGLAGIGLMRLRRKSA